MREKVVTVPDVIELRAPQWDPDAPCDLEWLLIAAGPRFTDENEEDYTPSNVDIFDRLDLFGRMIHSVESFSQQEVARQLWIDWLDHNAPAIAQPARVVQRAIDAGSRHETDRLARTNGWCDMNKLEDFEPPPSLIGDVIAEKAFVMLYGPYGSGKTFLSLDMALSVATGTPWHGTDVRQGAVGYVLGEGLGGIGTRFTAWREAHGTPLDSPFNLLPQPVDFGASAIVTDLLASIATWTTELKLLVIDTMFRCFVGNENSQEDVGAFVSGIDRCRQETGCAVLLVHHPGYTTADRGRGHSALAQALDQVIKVERDNDSGLITISCDKNRDGLPFTKRRFRLSPRAQSMVIETAELQVTPSAEAALAALHRIAAWDGASHATWYKATRQSSSTFNHALNILRDGDYVEKSDSDEYQLTDAGRALLGVST